MTINRSRKRYFGGLLSQKAWTSMLSVILTVILISGAVAWAYAQDAQERQAQVTAEATTPHVSNDAIAADEEPEPARASPSFPTREKCREALKGERCRSGCDSCGQFVFTTCCRTDIGWIMCNERKCSCPSACENPRHASDAEEVSHCQTKQRCEAQLCDAHNIHGPNGCYTRCRGRQCTEKLPERCCKDSKGCYFVCDTYPCGPCPEPPRERP
ncbi:hypothetical protein HYW17_05845 [Candidatus Uhrbacteria bacterium]|nr:hypothetical protein [Candidatus Uhrbacteria bacterium]